MNNNPLQNLTTLAMLAALSIISAALINFPLLPAVPFMKYDPADIPILIAACMFGPWRALLVVAVTSILQGVFTGADGGVIGVFMHFVATGFYAVVTGWIYQRSHAPFKLLLSLATGALAMVASMAICNLIFTPIFLGVPVDIVWDMMVPAILPFNILKASINGLATYFIFKSLTHFLQQHYKSRDLH